MRPPFRTSSAKEVGIGFEARPMSIFCSKWTEAGEHFFGQAGAPMPQSIELHLKLT